MLVNGGERSLVANLGAANTFTPDHLAKVRARYTSETTERGEVGGRWEVTTPRSEVGGGGGVSWLLQPPSTCHQPRLNL